MVIWMGGADWNLFPHHKDTTSDFNPLIYNGYFPDFPAGAQILLNSDSFPFA